jgi:RNA polymerase sigma-70 factor (ECF subfamily)
MRFQVYRSQEAELIERCRKQDRQAQELMYKQFSGKMYALCCRYVRDKMEAEDVLVMAFTKILERIDQYKGDGSFEGWIRRIVVNDALSHLRRSKNMYLETDIEAADQEPDYAEVENKMEAEDLMKMINELPAGYRIVFNMYAIDGFSHREIADQLGISENTSKSQLSRARALLQRNLVKMEKLEKGPLNEDEKINKGI